jgi:hypothetical protein
MRKILRRRRPVEKKVPKSKAQSFIDCLATGKKVFVEIRHGNRKSTHLCPIDKISQKTINIKVGTQGIKKIHKESLSFTDAGTVYLIKPPTSDVEIAYYLTTLPILMHCIKLPNDLFYLEDLYEKLQEIS